MWHAREADNEILTLSSFVNDLRDDLELLLMMCVKSCCQRVVSAYLAGLQSP